MKLYYSPGACSLAPHIVLRESGLPFTLVKASLKTHQLDDGADYYQVNPKGYVPLLELDDGTRLTENAAIGQYLADQVPGKRLAPPAGTMPRYRLQEWLSFVGSEIHKSFSPLFSPATPEDAKPVFKQRVADRLRWVDSQLAGKTWLVGDDFTVADAYLFAVARWGRGMGIDTDAMPNLRGFLERVAARPSVQEAMKVEGLK